MNCIQARMCSPVRLAAVERPPAPSFLSGSLLFVFDV